MRESQGTAAQMAKERGSSNTDSGEYMPEIKPETAMAMEEAGTRIPVQDQDTNGEKNFAKTLENRDQLFKLLEGIDEEGRNLLFLKEVEGYKIEELAEMFGLNKNTIKVKLFRARQKLAKRAEITFHKKTNPASRA